MNLNLKATEANTYDAIVVGSGISGGWAAKELTEKGLKTIMIERGRDIKHITDYETANKNPWELPHRGRVTTQAAEEYYLGMRTGYTANEEHRYLFENDKQNPIIENAPSTGSGPTTWAGGRCCGGGKATVGTKKTFWPMAKKALP